MPRVAIEGGLEQVKALLQENGYEVVDLTNQMNNVDAVVVSGQDKDMLGMQNTATNAPVINAEGLTAEELYQDLSNRFR